MKAITYMILIVAFSLSSCSSQNKMVGKPPFELGSATCKSWVGGRPETGSGLLLEIPLLGKDLGNAKLQQAYFRGKITDVEMEKSENGWVAKANFMDKNTERPDMVMHADPRQEVGNRPPVMKEKFPFELQDDQCVLSFLKGESIKYFKIEGIKENRAVMYK